MIEALVYSTLVDIAYLKTNLAIYNSAPAVFYLEAPHDQDQLWGKKQYPRVDFYTDWTANAERKTAGTLMVNVWCQAGKSIIPEDFTASITEALTNRFYKGTDGHYCTVWTQNDPFGGGSEEPVTIGITISFDVMAFPDQATFKPDPVVGVQNFIKTKFPDAVAILGVNSTTDTFTPGELALPVVYIRTDNQTASFQDTWAVRWLQVSIYLHIFTADVAVRNSLLRQIINAMVVAGECLLDDDSPLFFQQAKMDLAGDPLRNGQITINGRFGIIPERPEVSPLNNISIK